jgi:hypothetical protein
MAMRRGGRRSIVSDINEEIGLATRPRLGER